MQTSWHVQLAMAKKHNKNSEIKWYYDACALETNLNTYAEIINRRRPQAIVSHLALGEAYGNHLAKGEDFANAFIGLIKSLQKRLNISLTIVGNDDIDVIFDDVRDSIPRLGITDAMHLATAIKCGCCNFRTIDNDFIGMSKAKSKAVAAKYGINDFSISSMKVRE
jgi:predicted nucleic acid-binding protein